MTCVEDCFNIDGQESRDVMLRMEYNVSFRVFLASSLALVNV